MVYKLKAISSLVKSKQYKELELVIAEYEENIQRTKVVRYCKSAIIDAILSVYINKAEDLGIPVKVGFAFPDTFEVNESELATAIANALENAINASEKLDPSDRYIEIKVLCDPKFVIMIKNNFKGKVEFDEDDIPLNNDDEHGFGTRSIAALCNKIGGFYEFRARDGVFTVYMHLK